MDQCGVECTRACITRTAARREDRTTAARRGGWLTTGAVSCVAPVRALRRAPGTVHVCARVSRWESMREINRDGDRGTGDDG